MTFVWTLGWLAFGWSLGVGFAIANSSDFPFLLVTFVPTLLCALGLWGSFKRSRRKLTVAAAVAMTVLSAEPMIFIVFAPAALCLIVAATFETFFVHDTPVANGGTIA